MTLIHSTPLDVAESRVEGLRLLPFEQGLFEGSGSMESAAIHAERAFDRLVGSWNATIPAGASLRLEAQVSDGESWSAWYVLGSWKSGAGSSAGAQEDSWGKVNIDTLELKRPASAFRYRITLHSPPANGQGERPRLYRVAAAYWDSRRAPPSPAPFQSGPWVRELKLRPRSQMEEQEQFRHDICSPTSLAMVLDFWGRRVDTIAAAKGARDHLSGLFGNWSLNVAFAAERGLRGQLAQMDSLEELQREIAEGRPIVVSIAFEPGQLRGSPIRRTSGHLFVVAGFTRNGDVIAYDPAAKTRFTVRRVYRRADFHRAWLLRKRGIAYVLGPAFPELLTVGVGLADLRKAPDDKGELLSQLSRGERVRVLAAKGDWAKVEALEQPAYLPKRVWHGLTGWIQAAQLGGEPAPSPKSGKSGAPSADDVIEYAEAFLGKPYLWGGRSDAGVDCSGLVGLAYRHAGLGLPRDAHEQFLKAKPVPRKKLRPGDLVFLSKPGSPKAISHVMLYSGGDGLLESRRSAGKVLRTTFRERFGKELKTIENADALTDLTESPPAKRRVYFGSYF